MTETPRGDSALQGVIAAVPTPVGRMGAPDLARFLRHSEWALANGCDGLNILGTTGEANSFSAAARRQIMAAATAALPGQKLMVGTGTPDLETTAALTNSAAELGYGAALVLPPFYYKGVSDAGLLRYFTALAGATDDTPIPIYLYNFPALTGVPFSVDLVRRLAEETAGRICGIKDSSGDIPYCREIVAAIPGFKVFPSSETVLEGARGDGFAGCISATVNISAPLCGKIWNGAAQPGDAAEVARIRSAASAVPLIAAVKYLVARRFGDREWERVLPPLVELSAAEKSGLDGIQLPA